MKINPNESVPSPFKFKGEKRPWGYYDMYSHNEPCTSKILFVKNTASLSLQYHFKRDQFYMVLDDNFTIEYSSKPVPEKIVNIENDGERIVALHLFLETNLVTKIAKDGEMFGFHRFVVHRATYNGPRDYGRLLDIAFGDNDELDIVRIKDNYGRVKNQ